jgi:thiol-disulfide isomerase/thioredoxin
MLQPYRFAAWFRSVPWRFLLCLAAMAPVLGADDPSGYAGGRSSMAEVDSFRLADFQAVDLSGRHWTGEALKGRPVLIVFWATWCSRCVEEVAVLKEIRSEYGDQIELIGVNLDGSERPAVAAFLQRHRIDWPQIHEGRGMNGRLARLFKVPHLPFSVLYGADGQVISSAASICGLRPLLEGATVTTAGAGWP